MSINPDFYGSMNRFFNEVRSIFTEAQQKGYSRGAEGDGRDLLDFIRTHFGDHATGEAVYKLVRWQKKRDPKDLFKAAAWIFLIWDQYRRGDQPVDIKDAVIDQFAPTAAQAFDAAEHRYEAIPTASALSPSQQQMVSILDEIAQEAERADRIHKPLSQQSQPRRLKVLQTEVAEAAAEVMELAVRRQHYPSTRVPGVRLLRSELVQVAAVCANWIKALDGR